MRASRLAVLCGVMAAAVTASAFNKTMYPYHLPTGKQGAALGCIEAKAGMKLEPGTWYTNFQVCKSYADANGIPLVAVWSNEGCIHCWFADYTFIQPAFLEWKARTPSAKAIYCFMAGGYKGAPDQAGSAAYNWMYYGGGKKLNAYPFVVLWWAKEKVNERYTGDDFCGTKSLTDKSMPERVTNVTARIEKAFAKWSPEPQYAGGVLADPEGEGDRLEFEKGTKKVTVNLSRDEADAAVATNVTLVVSGPDGRELSRQTVTWAAGQTAATADVTPPAGACSADGQKLTLTLVDGGVARSTNSITYVSRAASAGNPLWPGEAFSFGEWTCDFDKATNMTAKASGKAYTLVSVQGSLWCPDCANTDRNFLDLLDEGGKNRFGEWAKAKRIALVSADIPNFNGYGADDRMSPTIFSKDAYATTLARAKEYPASGAPASLTNKVVRSGLGYLTRKGATDAQARAMLEKFHRLVSTNTDQGGFHRPEDVNKYRTGAPIFVLLRKDGTVAARFTRFAAVSPMAADRDSFDSYINRFEEMIEIADAGAGAVDASEIENNHPGAGATALAANGGTAEGRLCHADVRDAFRLEGIRGNALQSVTVKGTTAAGVTVQFYELDAQTGVAKALGNAATGKLSDGVSVEHTFETVGDYYVLVSASATDAALLAESPLARNFHPFTVKGATVLVPQADMATAQAPEGSNEVMIQLVTNVVYRLSGIEAAANEDVLEFKGSVGGYSFFTAKADGLQRLTLPEAGGEISYQIWQPGQLAFSATEASVPESVNDANDDWVEFDVVRQGGKSGRIAARVTLNADETTLAPDRYVFATNAADAVELVWEDGVTSNMTVRVKIIDDLLYDGDTKLVFDLAVVSSDASDVTVADGLGRHTLNVIEDDKAIPGRGLIVGTSPQPLATGRVYVRSSEGAKIWVKRIEGFDSLVSAELVSSVAGTQYETENPRDLETEGSKTYLYWANREGFEEKYVRVYGIPAGKMATVRLVSRGAFETVRGSNTVTVVSVADDAPAFVTAETTSIPLSRYVRKESWGAVPLDAATLQGGEVTFTKLSGTLPAGVKVSYDAEGKALAVGGLVTAKPGAYEVSYQVVETRLVGGAKRRVPGLTAKIAFRVVDPTDAKTNPEGANPSVAKARILKDLPVVSADGRLVGVLQLTIPTYGRVSGKYACESGTIALTASGWTDFDGETKDLSARIASRRWAGFADVVVHASGAVDVNVSDPLYPDGPLTASHDGRQWSAANTAEGWQGYYTVALPVEKIVESTDGTLVPTGCGSLTFDLRSASAKRTGTVRWAGVLPNGTAVSGSTVLGSPYKGPSAAGADTLLDWADLPIFKASSRDVLSVGARIRKDALAEKDSDRRAVLSADGVVSCWWHGERIAGVADSLVDLGVYGAVYDRTEDLRTCCEEFYQTADLALGFDVEDLVDTAYGVPSAPAALQVTVTDSDIVVKPGQANPSSITLRLNRATGVVSGQFRLPCGDKAVPATYRGVVVTGWGEGCGCGPTAGLKTLPLLNGSFWFSDRVPYGSGKTLSVKRGGLATIDK